MLCKIKEKTINHNIRRIQNNESLMCGLYCIDVKICYIILICFLQMAIKNEKVKYKDFKNNYDKS